MNKALEGASGLDGKVCVVTGAASGLGLAIAKALLAAGAKVSLLDRDESRLEREAESLRDGGSAEHAVLDVGDPRAVAEVFEGIGRRNGPIDVLVNSAGIREISDSLDLSFDEYDRVLRVNLSGTFYCAQQAGRQMRDARRGGSIVNVASVAGIDAVPSRAAYCSSKFGVIGLTQTMAAELGQFGIRVNALCPGLIRTPLSEAYFADEEFVARLPKVIPLGGPGQATDIADAALFLAGPASAYVTGIALPVDGGFIAARSFDYRVEPGSAFFGKTTSGG
jgi:NAD(P)-dependent dehydrogenase (short-subunit alcohol dehydrogenase family)